MALEKVNSPKDLKNLKREEMVELAADIRKALLNRLTDYPKGGHVGPNFGVVEMTIACLIHRLIKLCLMCRIRLIRIKF